MYKALTWLSLSRSANARVGAPATTKPRATAVSARGRELKAPYTRRDRDVTHQSSSSPNPPLEETNKKIIANIGRFGPYVNHDAKFKSIPKTDSVFEIDLARAVELLAQANSGPAPIRELGNHPTEDGQIAIYSGRYGPYVQHGKIRATIAKSEDPETLTLEEALELLAAKAAKDEPVKKSTAKKTTAKKPVAKKTAVKATSAKKVPAKKPAAKKVAPKKATAKK